MTARPRPTAPSPSRSCPRPTTNERRDGRRPDMILLHYTGMTDAASALHRLANPLAEVSSHYLVFEDGRIFQMVPEAARAWHAGVGHLGAATPTSTPPRSASRSSIPATTGGYPDFPAVQVEAIDGAVQGHRDRWGIRPQRDPRPFRRRARAARRDPGEKFPWDTLHAAGVGHWVPPAPLGDGPRLRSRRGRPADPGAAGDAGALRLRPATLRRLRRARPRPWSGLPAPLPAGAGGRHRRCLHDDDLARPDPGGADA